MIRVKYPCLNKDSSSYLFFLQHKELKCPETAFLRFNGIFILFSGGVFPLWASESLTSTEPNVMGMGSTNSLGVLLGVMGSRIIPALTPLVPSPMNFSYQGHCSPEDGAPFLQSIGSELALKHVFSK